MISNLEIFNYKLQNYKKYLSIAQTIRILCLILYQNYRHATFFYIDIVEMVW